MPFQTHVCQCVKADCGCQLGVCRCSQDFFTELTEIFFYFLTLTQCLQRKAFMRTTAVLWYLNSMCFLTNQRTWHCAWKIQVSLEFFKANRGKWSCLKGLFWGVSAVKVKVVSYSDGWFKYFTGSFTSLGWLWGSDRNTAMLCKASTVLYWNWIQPGINMSIIPWW